MGMYSMLQLLSLLLFVAHGSVRVHRFTRHVSFLAWCGDVRGLCDQACAHAHARVRTLGISTPQTPRHSVRCRTCGIRETTRCHFLLLLFAQQSLVEAFCSC